MTTPKLGRQAKSKQHAKMKLARRLLWQNMIQQLLCLYTECGEWQQVGTKTASEQKVCQEFNEKARREAGRVAGVARLRREIDAYSSLGM